MTEVASPPAAGGKLASAAITLVIGLGAVLGMGWYLHAQTAAVETTLSATVVGTVETPMGTMPHATIEMSVYADSASSEGAHGPDGGPFPGFVSYGPANHLILPANSMITMTIKGYDGGEELNHAYFGRVVGTVDGTATLDGETYTQLGVEEVQHTWTLHGLAGAYQDPLFVNIPLGKQPESAMEVFDETGELPTPLVTTFSFYTKGPGEYVWNCEFPCGDGTYRKFGDAMSQYGYMSGKVSVVEQS